MRFKWGGGGIRSSNRSILRASQGVLEPLESRRLLAVIPSGGFSAPGIDSNFGTGGLVRVDAFDQDTAQSLVIQGDGKIVVAGLSGPRTSNPGAAGETPGTSITVIRLTTNGSLDETFGQGGIVNIPFSSPQSFQYDMVPLAQLSDGSFVVGGPGGVRHISSSGVVDTSFAGDGRAEPAGFSRLTVGLGVTTGDKIIAMDETFDFVRLNADGTSDSTFGANGAAPAPSALSGGSLTSYHLYLQSDGKTVAVGYQSVSSVGRAALLRLDANGTPDTTFGGGDGVVITPAPTSGNYFYGQSVAATSGGKIILAGQSGSGGLTLARYLSDGTLDSTFGQGGILEHPDNFPYADAYDISIDDQGRIIVASSGDAWSVLRFNADGTLDSTFPGGGISSGNPLGIPVAAQNTVALALQETGDEQKIVVLGQNNLQDSGGANGGQDFSDFFIYRLGTTDPVALDPVRLVETRLEIDGTDSADTITLEHSGNNLVVHRNGTDTSFNFADVDQIVIFGLGGDDVISVPLPIPCVVNGNNGNDSITTGSGDDLITTGLGNDTVHAGAGDDVVTSGASTLDPGSKVLFGEDGNDGLEGSGGPDTLMGGAGRDALIGYAGADYLSGGGGKDKIAGVGGNDRIRGGAGDDQLDGGTGNDRIFGDDGNDKLFAGRGQNFLDAGAGNDHVFTINDGIRDTLDGGDGQDSLDGADADAISNFETIAPV